MRLRSVALTFASCTLLSGVVSAQQREPRPKPTLAVRAVRFYETGVGYFERKGRIEGSSMTLPLPTAHLDDALKSLVVLSNDNKARAFAVEFESTVGGELGKALAGVEGDGPLDWTRVLRSLKGADVNVSTRGEQVRGRLVDVLDASSDENVECADRTTLPVSAPAPGTAAGAVTSCQPLRSASLVVLSESGAVRRFRATQVTGVRPVDAGLASRLRTALAAIAPRSDQLPRGVRILGTPGSELTLGYVSETPVWRSTYRVVWKGDRAALQGWALIHNDTDEDWRNIKVELVNGRPDAFLYPLAAPRYARRELVTPDEQLSTVPQLLADGSADRQWSGEGRGGLGLSGVGAGGGGRGEGIGLGQIGTLGHGSGTATYKDAQASTELSIGSLAGVNGADGIEAEAMFRYSLPNAIDLRAHGSALVPFVSKALDASRITWFPKPGRTARSAARVKNDSGQTLPAGTIAFFADGGFSGESLLERMKPDDVRVLGFGDDLDVSLETHETDAADDTRTVTVHAGGLREHYVRTKKMHCEIENRSGTARSVLMTLSVIDNARVEGAELDYDSQARTPLARFAVPQKTTLSRTLKIEEALERRLSFGELTSRALERLASAPKLAAEQKQLLTSAAAQLRAAERARDDAARLTSEHAVREEDVRRLRENLAAAGKSGDAAKFRERLLKSEDDLRVTRERLRDAQRIDATAVQNARGFLGRLPPART